jgi:DNA-binding winged helix-turn-helix (wHTH) protein
MPNFESATLLRFESFELDLRTRELRKNGRLIKMQDLPVRLLTLLASRHGELVTREEIEKALWREDEFVDFDHGINTAMRKIRDALGEQAEQPRFIETLPRKGYRFLIPVEAVGADHARGGFLSIPPSNAASFSTQSGGASAVLSPAAPDSVGTDPAAALRAETAEPVGPGTDTEYFLPRTPSRVLFLAIQFGYLAMYCTALYKTDAMGDVLGEVLRAPAAVLVPAVLTLAMCGIAVRLYLLTSVGLNHPAAGVQYRRIFPVLFVLDVFWATSPLLLVRKIGFGLALAAAAALAYLPFAQRTLNRSVYRPNPGG